MGHLTIVDNGVTTIVQLTDWALKTVDYAISQRLKNNQDFRLVNIGALTDEGGPDNLRVSPLANVSVSYSNDDGFSKNWSNYQEVGNALVAAGSYNHTGSP